MVAICAGSAACIDKDTATFIPTSTDMQKNLEEAGYTVVLTDELEGGYSGAHLKANKEDEYIEFYWLDDSEACDYFYNRLFKLYPINRRIVKMMNKKFGNIVFCGTESAIKASGIEIEEVEVPD